jgi:predicted nucleic acid-binding protein
MGADEAQDCRKLLAKMCRIELDSHIREATINLRREYRLKLPDALIDACAIYYDAILLTNDKRLLSIPGLRCQSLELKSD